MSRYTVREICRLFGVPAWMLDGTDRRNRQTGLRLLARHRARRRK